MRKTKFENGEIYHLYNRGVDKRKIFLDGKDYFRFIHNLFEFNDEEPALNIYYKKPYSQSYETGSRKIESNRKARKLIVEILAFCAMPNHFHLLVKQLKNNGISQFMHKLGIGHTLSFNQKHGRSGRLFEGPYKVVEVKNEAHFIHLPHYIHLNPLDLVMPEWRTREIKDHKKAIKFLENYRWSSFLDYIGKKNFPSVTQREFLLEFFDGPEQYRKGTVKWLEEIDLEEIKDLTLEN